MGMPDCRAYTVNTPIMSILCNAMQFKVRCRMPDPDRVRFRRANPASVRRDPGERSRFVVGQNPSPIGVLLGERFERPQLFGLAASIAARLTIWPISLA